MEHTHPKIMYIQVRHGDVREHELQCFEKSLGVTRDHITVINVFDRVPNVRDLAGHDALIMGGSGDYCVSRGDIKHEVNACAEVVRAAYERNMPTLAICFGAHVLTQALGGKVEYNVKRRETGTFEIELLDEALRDPLFTGLPQFMLVQQGHNDGFAKLPPGAMPLARSLRWPYQAYVMAATPVYAVQFHPELTADDIIYRLHQYRTGYVAADEDFDALINSLKATPEASTIPRRFMEMCIKRSGAPVDQEELQYAAP